MECRSSDEGEGDLHQPGTPAIVLKLASSWAKVKSLVLAPHQLLQDSDSSVAIVKSEQVTEWEAGEGSKALDELDRNLTCMAQPQSLDKAAYTSESIATTENTAVRHEHCELHSNFLVPNAENPMAESGKQLETGLTAFTSSVTSGDHFLPSDDITVGTSVTSGACLQIPTADALEPVHQDGGVEEDNQNTGMHELDRQVKETPIGEEESSVTGELGTKVVDELEAAGEKDKEVVSDDSSQPVCDEENSMGEDYQKVEFAVLYWHKSTGYYYDPHTQLFYAPTYSQEQQEQQVQHEQQQQQQVEVEQPQQHEEQPVIEASAEVYSSYSKECASSDLQAQQSVSVSAATAGAGQSNIAESLAAASDRVMERCGYLYNEGLDMYYDAYSGLYYHQESKLYYDPDLACYLQYDHEKKEYSVHTRLKLPASDDKEEKRKSREVLEISSDEEPLDSPEEGEIRIPRYPRSSPPPEEEWSPCIRAYVSESKTLPECSTVFVITQDGAIIGREPCGTNTLIKIPELKISKEHAVVSYDKHEQAFMVVDKGSVNGTFLNKEQRLSQSRECSQPCPLIHGHTLTMGSTTLTIHIHSGWETCTFCDPAQREGQEQLAGENTRETRAQEELDVLRRKELNRIKKKYGLRMKDTYNEEEATPGDGYKDRSDERRRTAGSDVPPSQRPDESSSVDRPIEETNKGRRMLENMGWQHGEGLGRDSTGRVEPVRTKVQDGKIGLGMHFGLAGTKSQKMTKRFHDSLHSSSSSTETAKKRKTLEREH